jgi:hypothetical protein
MGLMPMRAVLSTERVAAGRSIAHASLMRRPNILGTQLNIQCPRRTHE